MSRWLHTPESKRLASWLKAQREAQGLSMRELAEKLDITHSYVWKVEANEQRIDVMEFLHYCKALGVSPFEGLRAVDKTLRDR